MRGRHWSRRPSRGLPRSAVPLPGVGPSLHSKDVLQLHTGVVPLPILSKVRVDQISNLEPDLSSRAMTASSRLTMVAMKGPVDMSAGGQTFLMGFCRVPVELRITTRRRRRFDCVLVQVVVERALRAVSPSDSGIERVLASSCPRSTL